MKKLFVIVFAFGINSTFFYGQDLKFGFKAGLNYANVSGSEIKTDAITSFHAGLISEIKILKNLSFQPELLYSTQGATYQTIGEDFKNELGYVAIPAMAKIYLNDHLSLEMGPQASFLLNERKNVNIKDSKTFDFSVVGGLSYKFGKFFFVSGRYGLGLTEIKRDSSIKNSVLQVSTGILF